MNLSNLSPTAYTLVNYSWLIRLRPSLVEGSQSPLVLTSHFCSDVGLAGRGAVKAEMLVCSIIITNDNNRRCTRLGSYDSFSNYSIIEHHKFTRLFLRYAVELTIDFKEPETFFRRFECTSTQIIPKQILFT